MLRTLLTGVALLAPAYGARSATLPSVYLEDLTWVEVQAALRSGQTTIIIPIGGTEQNGPHMALGKHNVRARVLAGKIAGALGNAIVAPVVSYTPEGQLSPPGGHMRYAGTITIPDQTFMNLLEAAAASFRQHGFANIVLIGDSGNYQPQLKAVAARLNRKWQGTHARVHWIEEYYRAAQAPFAETLRAGGMTNAEIGTHAGAADTSLAMAVDPGLVRADRLAASTEVAAGVHGDPRKSSATLGQAGVELIVTRTVAAIREAVATRH